MISALIQDDVIDGDIERMIGQRCLYLVGTTVQLFGPAEVFVHLHDSPLQFCSRSLCFGNDLIVGRCHHLVVNDFFINFYTHVYASDQNLP